MIYSFVHLATADWVPATFYMLGIHSQQSSGLIPILSRWKQADCRRVVGPHYLYRWLMTGSSWRSQIWLPQTQGASGIRNPWSFCLAGSSWLGWLLWLTPRTFPEAVLLVRSLPSPGSANSVALWLPSCGFAPFPGDGYPPSLKGTANFSWEITQETKLCFWPYGQHSRKFWFLFSDQGISFMFYSVVPQACQVLSHCEVSVNEVPGAWHLLSPPTKSYPFVRAQPDNPSVAENVTHSPISILFWFWWSQNPWPWAEFIAKSKTFSGFLKAQCSYGA